MSEAIETLIKVMEEMPRGVPARENIYTLVRLPAYQALSTDDKVIVLTLMMGWIVR